MSKREGVVIRMGASHWDATVTANGNVTVFNFRTMERKERSAFHRELMNAARVRFPVQPNTEGSLA